MSQGYEADASGRLVPQLPTRCVVGGEARCRIGVDHWRERKTGPCFALAVLGCGFHERRFTLYPPGHFPYGRAALAPCTPQGALVLEPDTGRLAWGTTIFAAAQDAAAGQAWPRWPAAQDARRWRTQGRCLNALARLVGIAADMRQRARERVAETLGVALLILLDAAEHCRTASGYRPRGCAIMAVLDAIEAKGQEASRDIAARMLASGTVGGLWGRPSRWDPGGQGFPGTFRPLAAVSPC